MSQQERRYIVINVDRQGTMPHIPESVEFDNGVVLDTQTFAKHILTGKTQQREVFRGFVPECVEYAQRLNELATAGGGPVNSKANEGN